jgi:hypothetical protein
MPSAVPTTDWFEVTVKNMSGSMILQTLQPKILSNSMSWTLVDVDVGSISSVMPFNHPDAGQNVMVDFKLHTDASNATQVYIDDADLSDVSARVRNTWTTKPRDPATGAGFFEDARYNQSIVGPVILTPTPPPLLMNPYNRIEIVFANWGDKMGPNDDGEMRLIRADCSNKASNDCTFTDMALPGWPPTDPAWAAQSNKRITTLTFSDYTCRDMTGICPLNGPTPVKLIATTGTKVWAWYPQMTMNGYSPHADLLADIDDTKCYTLPPAPPVEVSCLSATPKKTFYEPDIDNLEEKSIVGFISSTADPLYGDLYFEARDTAGHTQVFVLYIPNKLAVPAKFAHRFYNLGDMATTLGLKGQAGGMLMGVPYRYTHPMEPDGRVAAVSAHLIRMTVEGPDQNPTFINLPLWP